MNNSIENHMIQKRNYLKHIQITIKMFNWTQWPMLDHNRPQPAKAPSISMHKLIQFIAIWYFVGIVALWYLYFYHTYFLKLLRLHLTVCLKTAAFFFFRIETYVDKMWRIWRKLLSLKWMQNSKTNLEKKSKRTDYFHKNRCKIEPDE